MLPTTAPRTALRQDLASERLFRRRVLARAPWRRGAIVGIKVVHSVIFLVNSAAVLHLFWAGVRDRPSRWTSPALVAALAECVVFVANRGRCPLTSAVEALGADNGRVSDLFLPRWFADRIPQLCTPPLLIGVLALLFNAWRHRAHPRRPPAPHGSAFRAGAESATGRAAAGAP
jgi:hypothetical protein